MGEIVNTEIWGSAASKLGSQTVFAAY